MRSSLLWTNYDARVSILIINEACCIHIKVVEALNTAPATNFVQVHIWIAARGCILNGSQFKILFDRIVDVHGAFPCVPRYHLFDSFL
jgi:hypothetical protein